MSDEDALKRVLCIHFPHKLSDTMFGALGHPAIVDVLTQVIGPNVKAMQSMLFVKAAGKPGQAWHQDEDYIPTRDRSLTGAWISLDQATVENGCLWVIPGSHKHGILWDQEWHGDKRFDCSHESVGFPYTEKDGIPVEVPVGAVVFFNGYLLHRSLPNRSKSGFRRALVNHYMSAESFLPWKKPQEGDSFNGMGKLDYRDIVLVAGKDPYAHRGIQSVSHAHVRPSGEGGCVSWQGGKELSYKK
jgi:ectoine hydroxylase-related dioxygenase (phytanoyl-CoA dioxygenase family)